jgi:hypothetical protein
MGLFTDWCGKNQTKDKQRAIRNRAREVACEIGASKIGLLKQTAKGPRTSTPSTRSHLCA